MEIMGGIDDSADSALHFREVRRALKRSLLVESFLGCRYSLSPYMACGHGCRYCDGRAEKYWVEGDFARDIVVRRNLPQLLRSELPKLRERAPVAIGSGITDAYQPLEARQGLMRECARILSEHDLPVSLLTKSALVSRDADLWARVNAKSGFTLNMTIATLDERVRSRFEPGASPIEERLATLREFKKMGCPIGVMAMPVLPFISDGESDIHSLILAAKDAGADYVIVGGLTLRPGRQKAFYMEEICRSYPALEVRYRSLYAEEKPSGTCTREYRDELGARISSAAKGLGVPPLQPHALYRGRLPLYDELHLLLLHMEELYGTRGIPVHGLHRATARYTEWLSARKRVFNRTRKMRQEDLEQEVRALFASGRAEEALGNPKLAAFLGAVAREGKVFDYISLSLM